MKLISNLLHFLNPHVNEQSNDLVKANIELLFNSIEDIRSSIRSIDTKFNIFLLILLLPATHLNKIYDLISGQKDILFLLASLFLLVYWFFILIKALYIIKGELLGSKIEGLSYDTNKLNYFFPTHIKDISNETIKYNLETYNEIKETLKYEQLKLTQIFSKKYKALNFISFNTILLTFFVIITITHSLIWSRYV